MKLRLPIYRVAMQPTKYIRNWPASVTRRRVKMMANHYENANWLSRCTFFYLWPLTNRSRDARERLTSTDFDHHAPQDSASSEACVNLANHWRDEVSKRGLGRASMFRVIAQTYALQFVLYSLGALFIDCIAETLYFAFSARLIDVIGNFVAMDMLRESSNFTLHLSTWICCVSSGTISSSATILLENEQVGVENEDSSRSTDLREVAESG